MIRHIYNMEEEKYIEERIGKRNPFLVPDGYFDHLAEQVMSSLPEQPVQQAKEQPKAKTIGIRSIYYLAAAAVCALFVSVAVWKSFPQSTSQQADVQAQAPVAYQEPSDADFEAAADYIMLDNYDIYACLTEN